MPPDLTRLLSPSIPAIQDTVVDTQLCLFDISNGDTPCYPCKVVGLGALSPDVCNDNVSCSSIKIEVLQSYSNVCNGNTPCYPRGLVAAGPYL
uniref:Uncharacterized protein n=1 Tax=Romanomermis culicivorax TaxID=13658 RepID=A0A915KQF8_ROMCU